MHVSSYYYVCVLILSQQPYGDEYWGELFERARHEESFLKKNKKNTFNSRTGMGTGACCLKELGARKSFTAASRAYSCSLMWVYMCQHAMLLYIRPDTLSLRRTGHIHAHLREYMCGLMLLYIRPDTLSPRRAGHIHARVCDDYDISTTYVSSCCYICVLRLPCMCAPTALCVSSYYYICVLVLLYVRRASIDMPCSTHI